MLVNCCLQKYLLNFSTIMSQIFKVFQNEVSNQKSRRFHYFINFHKSLLKSFWKVFKVAKKSIFCQQSKSDIFKSFEYTMLLVSVGCNTPLGLLGNRISSSQLPKWKNAPCLKAIVAFLAVFGEFFIFMVQNISI